MNHRTSLHLVHAIRLAFSLLLLFFFVVSQVQSRYFVSLDIFSPAYTLFATQLFLTAFYFLYIKDWKLQLNLTAILFVLDSLFITLIIYYTRANQGVFFFLYLVNLILCGLVFAREGALRLALFTSACFSFLLIAGETLHGASLYFVVAINNLAFFAVAVLSGYLSEQLNFMGFELKIQKRNVQALKGLSEKLIENISSAILLVDDHKKISAHNRRAVEIFSGYLPGHLPSGNSLVGVEIQKLLPQSEKYFLQKETPYFESQLEKKTLAIRLTSFHAEDQEENRKSGFYVLQVDDLTDVREKELAKQQQEKLAAVGQLAAGIAHEIRNPLASMSGSIQMLKASMKNQEADEAKLMGIVIKETDRLNNLISEFLNFVKPEKDLEHDVELVSLLQEVVMAVKSDPQLRQDVVVKLELPSKLYVRGNRDKLKQVFLNFVINAYHAMEKTSSATLILKAWNTDQKVFVSIKDSGQGMSEEVKKRIFEPFFTTKARGTGLGLATVHKIIQAHQAEVKVVSQQGLGTEFIVVFSLLSSIN